ncbi:SDR family oxidoreductase [Salinicoccus roseus]|uniref:NAD-dependent dehydratase n=1 Tax=Salinicoccus roseus TaxID=45670 RepID=A0A0C2DK21_9STAP|nr:SDR family oxidoreductase [Salinicoccus roseus]KIH70328.1 NAD-dependent dehydratase [Salinicoccus roseus]MDB0580869.1 SDR family oxidoreductase [Salinicoccus roseus]
MKVLVIGANGQVGHQLVEKLKDKGHQPVAMVRKEEQVEQFKEKGIDTVLGDLQKDFSHAFEGVDSVVFAAGSGGDTGADMTVLIDQEGAIESVDNAEKAGVKHFVMLSSMGADAPKEAEQMQHYLYAKHRADEHLKASGLDFTILRPGMLTNDSGTGKVRLFEGGTEIAEIPREDVANVLAHIVDTNKPQGKTYYLHEGDTPVEDTL